MKTSKLLFALIAMLGISAAFADEGSTLISFSTVSDTYADGTTVLDGEWYALVWYGDEKFEGLNLDCSPVDSDDEIVYVSPLAKNGHCPDVFFAIPSAKAHEDGVYAVYLLDTRNAEKTAPAAVNGNNRPLLNGAVESQSFAVQGTVGVSAVSNVVSTTTATWAASEVDTSKIENYEPVTIKAIQVEGAKVKLTVANMLPGLKYNIRMGSKVNELKTLALPTPKTSNDDPVFVLDESDARFFKVVREPLTK